MPRLVVVKAGDHLVPQWIENLSPLLPDFQVVGYADSYEPATVEYIVGWKPDAHWINDFSALKAVVSIGSGVDHIANLSDLRPDIEVIRTVSPDLIQRMREFATLCVLSWHRQLPQMIDDTANRRWERHAVPTADEIAVGILGFGGMGQAVASSLHALGYDVAAWASQERNPDSIAYFHGPDGLAELAARSSAVICLLPLTDATAGIIDAGFLSRMPRGGCLISVGRGGHVVDGDLIDALESGHLSAAYLDVFREEPLPESSPLWTAKNTIVTGHSASYIAPDVGPVVIADNIKAFDSGRGGGPLYDRTLGY